MLLDIYTLAENETFNAVMFNAAGFHPLNSHDALQRLEVRMKDYLELTTRTFKEKRVILFIRHLFKPYDSIPRKRKTTNDEQARIHGLFIMDGYSRLRWIVKNGIPFILEDTEEMRADLETVRRNSPPLYDKVVAANLEEFAAKGGGLNTEPLERMGANNPDKDRDGEQYLYGDIVDWIRDVVGWKDHDLAVRLIGEYAINHCWGGQVTKDPMRDYDKAGKAYRKELLADIRKAVRKLIPSSVRSIDFFELFDEIEDKEEFNGASIYDTPDDVAGEFILKEFFLNCDGHLEVRADSGYEQTWFIEDRFEIHDLEDIRSFLERVAGNLQNGTWTIDENGKVHLPDKGTE